MTTNTVMLDSHLAKFCWRNKFGNNALNNLIIEIRSQYPVV